ncbi:MAG: Stp1/IreP family PP2C-type Ser/Thr phosphatase [Solirubrobacteraceae bacterium]|jgi:PPM family protein phosphatase
MLRVADFFADSDTGRARRANEDAFFAHAPVFAVADGMGGAQAGEVASRTVVDCLRRGLPDGGSPEERLAALAEEANGLIHRKAAEDEQRAGMGTTLTAAYVDEDAVSFGHVGDSRAYLFRDAKLQQLTNDHSLVGEMVRRGKLTAEQAEEHPQRSIITRALGPEPAVEVDHMTTYARDGDVFLLCSDGLTSMLSDEQIERTLADAPNLRAAGHALIDAANAAGGRDNITVILFRVEEAGGGATADQATMVGEAAPKASEVHEALASEEPATTATATATRTGVEQKQRAPKRPLPPASAPHKRRRRLPFAIVAVVAVVAVLGVAAWLATRAVFFVGTDSSGVVTIYRGLPYELPLGLKLYEQYYASGVPATELPARRRRSLLDNELRSRSDATDLVRQLETGQLR